MIITNRELSMGTVLAEALERSSAVLIAVGYVSPVGCELLSLHNHAVQRPLRLVVGRAMPEGIAEDAYNCLLELDQEARSFGGGVRVGDPSFHSKIYCVEQGEEHRVWLGSSNLTVQGLQQGLEATLPLEGETAEPALQEAERLWEEAIPVREADLTIRVPQGGPSGPKIQRKSKGEKGDGPPLDEELEGAPAFCVELAPGGEVPEGSGPNWWNGRGRIRKPTEAYIPLRKKSRDDAARVLGELRAELPFQAVTHDGQRMAMQLEATGGKNIASRKDKSIFGQWLLRDVLELEEGELLTSEHLEVWGRTDICLYRAGTKPETDVPVIYIDFSPPLAEGVPGEPWTPEEVEVAVRSYFLMFKRALRGEDLTKVRHRDRALKRLPARTEGAVELKYQNISSVLHDRGLDWLQGYPPRDHVQTSVVPGQVSQYLERHPALRAQLA